MTDIVGIIDQAFYGDIGILGKDCRKQHRHRSWLCRLDIEKPAFVDHFPHRFSSLPGGLNHTIRSYIHIPLYIYMILMFYIPTISIVHGLSLRSLFPLFY